MDFDEVYRDPQTVHESVTWTGLSALHQRLLSPLSAFLHSAYPTPIQTQLLRSDASKSGLTLVTGHQNCGKTLALCLFALSTAISAPEPLLQVLYFTPDDSRTKYVCDLLTTLHPEIKVLSNTFPPKATCSIAAYSLSRPQLSSRFANMREAIIKDVNLMIIDDADECLNTKENRTFFGNNLIGRLLEVRPLVPSRLILAQRGHTEWSQKFVTELIAFGRTKGVNFPPPLECTCDITNFPTSFQQCVTIGSLKEVIPRMFLQDRVVLSPPVLFVARTRPDAELVHFLLDSLNFTNEVIDCGEAGEVMGEKFSRFCVGSMRYLIVYPGLSRKYQTVRPGTTISVGLPMNQGQPDLNQFCEEAYAALTPLGHGLSILILQSEEEAAWLHRTWPHPIQSFLL